MYNSKFIKFCQSFRKNFSSKERQTFKADLNIYRLNRHLGVGAQAKITGYRLRDLQN